MAEEDVERELISHPIIEYMRNADHRAGKNRAPCVSMWSSAGRSSYSLKSPQLSGLLQVICTDRLQDVPMTIRRSQLNNSR
jgi:hypothetical protein